MEFRQCSISGMKHVENEGNLLAALDESGRQFNVVHHFTVTKKFVFFVQSELKLLFILKPYVEEFFISLALCHTVQVSIPHTTKREHSVNGNGYVNNTFYPDHFDYVYRASSPDEKALVEACRRYLFKRYDCLINYEAID